MLRVEFTGQFKRDFKQAIKRGLNANKLEHVVDLLRSEKQLPAVYKDHHLTNSKDYKGMRECHIEPDWLLIYKVEKKTLLLRLIRTGTHSDLFK
jgi:addiction module toxin, RelE/StbE family